MGWQDAPVVGVATPDTDASPASIYARNSAYAKPSQSGYITHLDPTQEQAFQAWVKQNKVPFENDSPTADYDMRGFYMGLQSGDPAASTGVNQNDGKLHFSDKWKTPYHKSFSAESQWAGKGAPKWNEQDQLVTPDGRVVFDERAKATKQPAWMSAPTVGQKSSLDPSEYDPTSPAYQVKYGAAAVPASENFAAGAGKSVVDMGRGLQQLGAEGLDLVAPRQQTTQGLIAGTDPSRGGALRREQDEIAQRDTALMSTGAGVAGNIAGTVATTVLPGTLAARGAQVLKLGRAAAAARAFATPATYGASIASGAAQGALQPVGTEDSRTLNTALGAATGGAARLASGVVGRIAQPVKKALSKEDARAVRTLTDAGVPLDLSQRTGSKAAAVVKRAIDDNPLTGPGQKAFAERQQKAFTRAVLKTIGEDADTATADVMGAAQQRIGQVFDDVAERNPVTYDGKLHADIATLSKQAHKDLVSQDYGVISRQIDEIFDKATQGGGQIDGAAYQNLRSSLGNISQQRTPLGNFAGQLRETIDDALQRSAEPEDFAALKTARQQYRRMLQIEGAIDTEGAGRISAPKLANSLGTKTNRRASIYGRGDTELVRLAQAGKKLLPDKFPNSGTPARLAGQLLAPAALGLGVGAATGDTGTGLGTAAGTAGLLLGARGGMNNQLMARYLSEGLRSSGARNVLMAPARTGLLTQAGIASLPALQE